ncbi:MAG TPA: hypothetical protein VF309_08230, partial [Usitatibacter sp.]
KMRATWSTEPPGGNTAMILTGLFGHAPCEWAASGTNQSKAQANAANGARDFNIEISGMIRGRV